jgi:hypothetical protein
MHEYLSVGVVLKPHGLKGEIKVKPLTDDERRFDNLYSIYLKEEQYRELNIVSRRYVKNMVYLKLPRFLCFTCSNMACMDSSFAGPINPQVLTTIISAFSG